MIRRRLGRIAPIVIGAMGVLVPVHHGAAPALVEILEGDISTFRVR